MKLTSVLVKASKPKPERQRGTTYKQILCTLEAKANHENLQQPTSSQELFVHCLRRSFPVERRKALTTHVVSTSFLPFLFWPKRVSFQKSRGQSPDQLRYPCGPVRRYQSLAPLHSFHWSAFVVFRCYQHFLPCVLGFYSVFWRDWHRLPRFTARFYRVF